MFKWYTAVLFWKSQSPWPALRGGLYDYYLGVTGGFYGVRAALVGGALSSYMDFHESGWVHGQMNLGDRTLSIVTAPGNPSSNGKLSILILVWTCAIFLPANCHSILFPIAFSSSFCLCNCERICLVRT